MNFKFHDIAYSINCDWLQYSVRSKTANPELFVPDGYRLEIAQGTNIFENRALFFDACGRKVLTFLWKPYSKVIDENIITVQVANEFLYKGDLRDTLSLVKQVIDCEYNNIGRLDLCCDFEITDKQLQIIKHLNSNHYYAARKHEGSTWWHEVNQNGIKKKQIHCLTWGSAKSEIKVKLYNKSREQGLVGGVVQPDAAEPAEPEAAKPWIVENWKEMDMDVKKVWRLEFSLSGANQLRWGGRRITLDEVSNWSWIVRTFFDLYHNRFVLRVNQRKVSGHHNDDKRVELLDLPLDGEHLEWAENEREPRESKPAITLLRSLMRNLENEVLQVSKPIFNQYAQTIINLVESARLNNYFQTVFLSSPEEYFSELGKSIGCGKFDRVLPPSKFMD